MAGQSFLLRWIGRLLLLGVILIVVLVLVGLVREARIRHRYEAAYPAPGQMEDIGTHALHLRVMGTGSPTVVFESDLDQFGLLSWAMVQQAVSQFTRTVSYDRAGIMWSDPGPRPRDGETIARELHAALDAAGESAPFVLVGHAMGGAYVRIFAGHYLSEVCGVVLIDATHPDALARLAAIGLEKKIPPSSLRPLVFLVSHLGLGRGKPGPQYSLPDAIYEAEQAFLPKSSLAWFDEMVEVPRTLAQSSRYQRFGTIPLIVLASSRPTAIKPRGSEQDLQEMWLESQQEFTQLSSDSDLRLCEDSGHYIQFGRPDVVVQAIRDIVTAF